MKSFYSMNPDVIFDLVVIVVKGCEAGLFQPEAGLRRDAAVLSMKEYPPGLNRPTSIAEMTGPVWYLSVIPGCPEGGTAGSGERFLVRVQNLPDETEGETGVCVCVVGLVREIPSLVISVSSVRRALPSWPVIIMCPKALLPAVSHAMSAIAIMHSGGLTFQALPEETNEDYGQGRWAYSLRTAVPKRE